LPLAPGWPYAWLNLCQTFWDTLVSDPNPNLNRNLNRNLISD